MTVESPQDMTEQLDAAIAQCWAALADDPCNVEVLTALRTALDLAGRGADMEQAYLACLSRNPCHVEAVGRLGVLLRSQGRLAEALEMFEDGRSLAPLHFDFYVLAASAAIALRELEKAEKVCRIGLAMSPDRPTAVLLEIALAAALLHQTRATEAIDAYRRALAMADHPERYLLSLSIAQAAAGDLDGARDSARRHLAALDSGEDGSDADSVRAECFYQIVSTGRCTADMPERVPLKAFVARLPEIGETAARAQFALAKLLSDLGDHEAAFAAYAAGNAARRPTVHFDLKAVRDGFAALAETFSHESVARWRVHGNRSDRPVFIVGMPRSGTSLVEQILASHPLVHGNGELDTLSDFALGRAPGAPVLCAQQGYPQWLLLPEAPDLMRLIAGNYLFRATRRAGHAARVTDKMPLNFRHVGLIAVLFPNARIIHVRRDPLDTCVACYTTLFADGNAFSYDLGELGGYYRAYTDLMVHWRSVLPPGMLTEVSYESLVHQPETESRRLIAAIGLPWDDACLDFRTAARGVLTASAAQVRQDVYTTSVGRAAIYQAHLGPLRDALGPLAT